MKQISRTKLPRSRGLVIRAANSRSKGRGFESRHILNGKLLELNLKEKVDKNNQKDILENKNNKKFQEQNLKIISGIIFMGVLDDGEVNGVMMSPFQQHHFLLHVQDTFDRYSPKVPSHLYKIKFVPVVEPGDFRSYM